MRSVTTARALLGLAAATIPGGIHPAAEAQEPAGTLIVTNKGANTASLVDLASGAIVATIAVGNGPHEVAVSNDGRLAVATNYGARAPGNSLTVIDVVAGRAIRTVDLGRYSRPHGVYFLPGDSVVSVTSETTSNVVLVNILSGTVGGTITTDQSGSHMITRMAADGRAFTSNIRSGTISEVNLLDGSFTRVIDVAPQVEAIQLSPRGDEVWVGSNALGTVSVVSASDGSIRGTIEGFSFPYRIAFSPDASTAMIPDLNGDVVRFFDTVTLAETARLSLPGAGPEGVAIVTDEIAYLSLSRQDVVAVIDLGEPRVVRRLPTGRAPDGVGYSPLTVAAAD